MLGHIHSHAGLRVAHGLHVACGPQVGHPCQEHRYTGATSTGSKWHYHLSESSVLVLSQPVPVVWTYVQVVML